jgi:hypothetical protein
MAKSIYKDIDDYFKQQTHPLKKVGEHLRNIISKTDKAIGEQVKWNSPAFYYTGAMKDFDAKEYKRDIVVFNLSKKDHILLVFPSGNKIPTNPVLGDENMKDGRKMVQLFSMDDVKKKEAALKKIIKEWISMVNK